MTRILPLFFFVLFGCNSIFDDNVSQTTPEPAYRSDIGKREPAPDKKGGQIVINIGKITVYIVEAIPKSDATQAQLAPKPTKSATRIRKELELEKAFDDEWKRLQNLQQPWKEPPRAIDHLRVVTPDDLRPGYLSKPPQSVPDAQELKKKDLKFPHRYNRMQVK